MKNWSRYLHAYSRDERGIKSFMDAGVGLILPLANN